VFLGADVAAGRCASHRLELAAEHHHYVPVGDLDGDGGDELWIVADVAIQVAWDGATLAPTGPVLAELAGSAWAIGPDLDRDGVEDFVRSDGTQAAWSGRDGRALGTHEAPIDEGTERLDLGQSSLVGAPECPRAAVTTDAQAVYSWNPGAWTGDGSDMVLGLLAVERAASLDTTARLGDLDGDGRNEALWYDTRDSAVCILEGRHLDGHTRTEDNLRCIDGVFSTGGSADLDGDGFDDLVLQTTGGHQPNDAILVFRGEAWTDCDCDGDGWFGAACGGEDGADGDPDRSPAYREDNGVLLPDGDGDHVPDAVLSWRHDHDNEYADVLFAWSRTYGPAREVALDTVMDLAGRASHAGRWGGGPVRSLGNTLDFWSAPDATGAMSIVQSIPKIWHDGGWQAVGRPGDADGDGIEDLVVVSEDTCCGYLCRLPGVDLATGVANHGTGSALYTVEGELGDLDGDGVDEILSRSLWPHHFGYGPDLVAVFTPADGEPLGGWEAFEADLFDPTDGDGDGYEDVVIRGEIPTAGRAGSSSCAVGRCPSRSATSPTRRRGDAAGGRPRRRHQRRHRRRPGRLRGRRRGVPPAARRVGPPVLGGRGRGHAERDRAGGVGRRGGRGRRLGAGVRARPRGGGAGELRGDAGVPGGVRRGPVAWTARTLTLDSPPPPPPSAP
jgi:hypothetical protein